MTRPRREAASGAQIVVWKRAARVLIEGNAAMLAGAPALARELHIYLLACYVASPKTWLNGRIIATLRSAGAVHPNRSIDPPQL
jgi:hypothetical protein